MDDYAGMAERLAHIRQRIAEANDAYGDDDDGLRSELSRIAEEVGLPADVVDVEIDTTEAAVAHLIGTQMSVLESIAEMSDNIDKVMLMMIQLVEEIAGGTAKKWCRQVMETAAEMDEFGGEKDSPN